ncbi:MAG: FAD binding domain-containing protein [Acidobacteria bacterium]|nr:FAD binding domain-containing protein [Acidobacteriota bacterium]MCW5968516.1 FAD binding domain-containing protein [Blastocatellales bacterium]
MIRLQHNVVHRPRTIDDACTLLAEYGPSAQLLAGGTDIMVLLNAGLLQADVFIDLWPLDELRGIDDLPDSLRIGALTTFSQILRSPAVERFAPALAAAARTIGAAQIQNRGTIGGNIANASPAADSLPVLSCLDADIELASVRSRRRVSIHSFHTGYRKTALAADEMIVAVHLPKTRTDERIEFYKVGTRRAQAISKVVLGARMQIAGGIVEHIALAYGSVAPTVVRARAAEAILLGQYPSPELASRAVAALDRDLKPITDLRSSAAYRRRVAGNLLERFLRKALQH